MLEPIPPEVEWGNATMPPSHTLLPLIESRLIITNISPPILSWVASNLGKFLCTVRAKKPRLNQLNI